MPAGTPDGTSPAVAVTSAAVPSCTEPIAYTIVLTPSVSRTVSGPSTTVGVPASTTSAVAVPAGTSAFISRGLVKPANTVLLSARTSTAGASAVCRTTSRARPAALGPGSSK